jgi:sugar transferase (PEP-CTERM/EpsH1 system associated)
LSLSDSAPKKILFLTPRIPYPPLKGDQLIFYHRLRTLGVRHEITLLTFVEGDEDPRAEEALRPYCRRIVRVPHPKWRVIWNLLFRGFRSSLPLQVTYYRSPEFHTRLHELLREDFDLVHAFMLRLRPYLETLNVPVILECIDSMRLNMGRQADSSSGWMRWIYLEELRRMDRYEPAMDAHIGRAIFVSPLDAKYSGSTKTMVISNGVVVPARSADCAGAIVAFSGNMAYGPNALAATWFVRHCWGTIHERHPQARFRILGGGATAEVRALANEPGVEVRGAVADMAEALLEASVAVAPMQSGSGMQNKILEAMACGVPVVATSLGKGAIAAGPDQGLWVADDPKAMIEAVCALLADPTLRQNLGVQGRDFVATHHSWEQAAEVIERVWGQSINLEH